ncbi:Folylpolyglutamate synthetase [Diplodia intermedia]|uniref:Folylpolyglutamate synthetase n=1 Tax=Diplodia intermedia TaxID=856260 RepID=A0ABR3TY75_9PEZI
MNTHLLNTAPEYEALSYVWGSSERTHAVMLNQHSFAIQSNLHDALEHLRHELTRSGKSTRKIWIDAICINQQDKMEKSSQVMIMGDIYANASRVLVWLGKADNFSKIAFDTLAKFAVNDGTKNARITSRNLQSTMTERTKAVECTIIRPYFERAWVVQEVVSAKEAMVCCGELLLPFDTVFQGVSRMTGSGYFPFTRTTAQITSLGMWRDCFLAENSRNRDEALDLRILFLDSRNKKCQDARDKVYALKAIGSKSFTDGINVDYNKDVEDVYVDCAIHLLESRKDLRVLSSVILYHRQTTGLDLPSWVPDWTQPKSMGGVLQRYYRFAPEKFFRAAGNTVSDVAVLKGSEETTAISIRGKRIDTIDRVIHIKDFLGQEDNSPMLLTESRLTELADMIASNSTYPFTGEAHWKALFRTLTADRSGVSSRVNDEFKQKYLSSCGNYVLKDDDLTSGLPDAIWKEISKSMCHIVDEMDMFLTGCGYFGLGHKGIHAGDVVCVLLGGEVPFLLRQVESCMTVRFEFLCETYLHGVMDGEAMMEGDENVMLESFHIT